MFPNLAQKECITEDVPEEQWNLVLDSVEANFRKNANRNLSDAEIATRLSNFKRPVKIEFGLLTMAPTKNDRSQKPISYVLTGSSGEVIGTKSGVTQEEIDFKTVGTNVSVALFPSLSSKLILTFFHFSLGAIYSVSYGGERVWCC